MKIGRNDPCHCNSGKKYKKCCQQQDEDLQRRELEEQQYQYDVQRGLIDPFAGDDDWEEEVINDWADEEEYFDSTTPPDITKNNSSPPTAETNKISEITVPKLSNEESAIVEKWLEEYTQISDPDTLRNHIENFMDLHPGLVTALDLDDEPLLELEGMYVRQGKHKEYIKMLTRLHTEFPDAYRKGFPNFDSTMISWLIINDQKDTVTEYLNNFREDPCRDPDSLFEVIYFLMSWNCQEILTDFLPAISSEVSTSPKIIGGAEILSPVITIIMAPYLAQGLDGYDLEKLTEEIKKLGNVVNPMWTDHVFLQRLIKLILGRHEQWNLKDCRTRIQATERYHDMCFDFMGWLVENKCLDWCAAEYHRQRVFEYLFEALPETKQPRTDFPFEEINMEHLIVRLSKNMMWLDPGKLFGMLHGLYWFQDFLKDSRSLSPEQTNENQEACVRIFEKAYPGQKGQDFKTLAWEKFPRER